MSLLRTTKSTDSPNALPTTGISDDADLIPLAANPSTLLVNPPSKESKLIKRVIITPNVHVTPDFINLDNLTI